MKLLITGALKKDEDFFAELCALGHEITYIQEERIPLWEQKLDPSTFEGVICNGLFLYTPIEQFPSLRYIQLTSAGCDRVPLDYVRSHGIALHRARGVYSSPMAEYALCGVLQLYKQSRFFYENQRAHRWEKHRGLLELNGKNVCIVGCGSVGTECAKRFGAFGCHVYGIDLCPRNDVHYLQIAALSALDAALAQADVVVLTIPLTEATFHLMDAERFGRLKPTAILVNISRGAVVEEKALEAALPKLGGAVLDVFEAEPLDQSSPLWDAENVILTPHNSFVGDLDTARLHAEILANLSAPAFRKK